MSILIKGMDMPTSCPCELVGAGYDLYCSFVYGVPKRVREYDECCKTKTRPEWCPLVEVPTPHGRLIDADALNYTMLYKENWIRGTGVEAPAIWKKDIDAAPTIIPASEEVE